MESFEVTKTIRDNKGKVVKGPISIEKGLTKEQAKAVFKAEVAKHEAVGDTELGFAKSGGELTMKQYLINHQMVEIEIKHYGVAEA